MDFILREGDLSAFREGDLERLVTKRGAAEGDAGSWVFER